MTSSATSPETTLQIRRTFQAPRERVFRAWTEPEELRKWWRVGDNWSSPIVEVDLREGGSYRIGMKNPDADQPHITIGMFKEVNAPGKLVYTWSFEAPGQSGDESLVTVEFLDKGGVTEVVLTHEKFADQHARDEHNQGWNGVLDQLAKIL